MIPYVRDDGGRTDAGFKGETGDCVVRAIAIGAELSYGEVYRALRANMRETASRRGKKVRTPRSGVPRSVYERFLFDHGWCWEPCMEIGSGCQVHLRPDELPAGRLIVAVSRHLVAVVNRVIHDTHDPSRGGTRCVYGFYFKPETDSQLGGAE